MKTTRCKKNLLRLSLYSFLSRYLPIHLEFVVALREEGVDEDGEALLLLEGRQNVLQQLQLTVPEVLH